ncbi:DUF317 domain-containing protein [Streptomyces sp. NRRL B-24572]|uniref:DUF317 domain-containing protein n=1 Tax=Streptomyces sp. NRRL B-24572 TaxID=1962156 RepID=UPI000A3916DB
MEAPLYPQHSSDSRPPEHPYRGTPRHLAGDDEALADQVGAALAAAGWRMWPTARDTLLYTSPNGLCGAEWTRAACSFELGDLPVAWQISARSHPSSTLPEWNAYFTAGVPHETLTDFLLALDARTEPAFCFDGPEAVLVAVCAQGWARDIDRPRTAALAPGLTAGISLEQVPSLVRDADPRPERLGWQAWAEPRVGDAYLWWAAFSGSTPHDLVAIFASSLASPHPVQRSSLPAGVEGQLTVIHPRTQRQPRARGPE